MIFIYRGEKFPIKVYLSYLLKLYIMAVPKKRTSKAKTRSRKACWKRQAVDSSLKAISLAKSVLTFKSNSYIYVSKNTNVE